MIAFILPMYAFMLSSSGVLALTGTEKNEYHTGDIEHIYNRQELHQNWIPATDNITDTTSPVIAGMMPAPGTSIDTGTPEIKATFADRASGIDAISVVIKIDSVDVTSGAAVSETGVTCTPAEPLTNGTHSVQIIVYDNAGNRAYKAWSFIVSDETDDSPTLSQREDSRPPEIRNIRPANYRRIDDYAPRIYASYTDSSKIDTSSITLKLDSKDVSNFADITSTDITYYPPVSLDAGNHYVELQVSDVNGNEVKKAWSFRIVAEGEPISGGQVSVKIDHDTKTVRAVFNKAIDTDGKIKQPVKCASADNKLSFSIASNTIAQTGQGSPPEEISVKPSQEWPSTLSSLPKVGIIYSLEPEGTSFDPPATLVFKYDEAEMNGDTVHDLNGDAMIDILDLTIMNTPDWPGLPEDFFTIAYFDREKGGWVVLQDSMVDTENNTVTAAVSHFSDFTIIAHRTEQNTPVSLPEDVIVKNIEISDASVKAGSAVRITATVVNTGDNKTIGRISLNINGKEEKSREIELAGQEEKEINFSITKETAGDYLVDINGQVAEFTVQESRPINFALWSFIGSSTACILSLGALLIVYLFLKRKTA